MYSFNLSVIRPHDDRPADLLWETTEYASTISQAVKNVSRNIPEGAMVIQTAYLRQQRHA